MAGALKHKKRSQYSYHEQKPYTQFYRHAAKVQQKKNTRSLLDVLREKFTKRTTNK